MAGLWRLDGHYMTDGVAYQQQSSERPVKWAKKFSFGVSSLQHGGLHVERHCRRYHPHSGNPSSVCYYV